MTISRVDQGIPPPVSPTDGNTYTSLAQNKLCMPRLLTAILTPTPPDHSSSFFFFFPPNKIHSSIRFSVVCHFRSVQSLARLAPRGDARTIQQRSSSSLFFRRPLWAVLACPLFDVVHAAFPLRTTASPTLQGVLKSVFGEAVVACGIPEPCEFRFLDSCQKWFLWTHEEVDLPPHRVLWTVNKTFTRYLKKKLFPSYD